MPSSTSNSKSAPARFFALERRFLCVAWLLLPLAGAALGLAWGLRGWAAVALDPALAVSPTQRGPWLFAAVGAAAGGALVACWWIGLALEASPWLARRPFTVPFALAAAGLLVLELGVRLTAVQSPLWLSVRARLRPGYADYFIRELTYWRLDALGPARNAPRSLVVAGSSQVLHGFDFARLAELTGRPVKRRALAGMDPLKACGAQDWLQVQPGDTLVLYLSEFDFSGGDRLDLNWMRPLTSRAGARDVTAALSTVERGRQWRPLVDLHLAGVSELWRVRDYLSHILFHAFGPLGEGATDARSALREQERVYAEGTARESINASRLAALRRLVLRVKSNGGGVVIFEGQVNPSLWNPNAERLRGETRTALSELANDLGMVYVPVSEQKVTLAAADWLDGTHMNEEGRRKFTEYAAGLLRLESAGGGTR